MKIIVGLGNPGKKYVATRHNAGFMILDKLAKLHFTRFRKPFFSNAYVAKTKKANEDILLIKPAVFMNNSGLCLRGIMSRYGVESDDILVIYDDVDLSLGIVRFRAKGRSAGHKGMDSIIRYLGTSAIQRIKIGIGMPDSGEEIPDYVLSNFTDSERETLNEVIEKACRCCWSWIDKDTSFIMRECN